MKRDMDLVRKILFAMEDEEKRTEYTEDIPIKVDGYKREVIGYHMKIMAQAGLLHVDLAEHPNLPGRYGETMPKFYSSLYSISWDGHEFLSAARDNNRWKKAKDTMDKAGGLVLPVLMQLLTSYVKAELKLP